jgi:hypothetical protein
MLFDDFPELAQSVDSPHVSRPWDYPINTSNQMRSQRLNRVSPAEREELNRHLKDVVGDEFVRPIRSEL